MPTALEKKIEGAGGEGKKEGWEREEEKEKDGGREKGYDTEKTSFFFNTQSDQELCLGPLFQLVIFFFFFVLTGITFQIKSLY